MNSYKNQMIKIDTSYTYNFLLFQIICMASTILFRSVILYLETIRDSLRNYNQFISEGHFPLLICYMLISLLFLYSLYIYDKLNLFSELLYLLTLQIIIYSIVVCSIVTKLHNRFSKNQLIFANIHILFVIYYFLVFQLMLYLPNNNYTCIISLGLAVIMLMSIVTITKKENFNERIWAISVNLSVMTGFELHATKYISIVAIVVLITNLAISINREYFKVYTSLIRKIYPEIGEFEKRKPIHIYATLSIVFWCVMDQLFIDKFEKTMFANILTFTVLGFWVPNIILILQFVFYNSLILPLGMLLYVALNTFIFLARLHGNNLRQDYEYVKKVDSIFEELIVKAGENTAALALTRYWRRFNKTAKDASSMMVGPNGPTRWGATAGAAVGFGTTTYFGSRYIKSQEEANDLAKQNLVETKRANAVAEQNLVEIRRANDLAEQNLVETKRANAVAERQAIATEESNIISSLSLAQSVRYNDHAIDNKVIETFSE